MIYLGDSRAGMALMPDNTFDSIVTDPPYGLSKHPDMREVLKRWLAGDDFNSDGAGFMGKKWDSFVPGPKTWEQAYRVLKPGGYLVAFAGSRTVDLMATSLRLGGFEVVDMLHWLYGTGFPKSTDISKALDKLNGRPAQPDDGFRKYLRDNLKEKGLRIVDLDRACGTNGMAGHWTRASQPEYPTQEKWSVIKALLFLDDRYDSVIARVEAQRKVVGQQAGSKLAVAPGQENDRSGKSLGITEAHTEEAKQWDGWGTALKPCHEPIILCRKPLDGTYANNVLTHGVGALNIDGCRLEGRERTEYGLKNAKRGASVATGAPSGGADFDASKGRWPGNVLHDGCLPEPMDRYFYSAKATKADREAGLQLAALTTTAGVTGRKEGSAGLDNPRAGTRGADRANTHPTVKPTDLMRWLCRLVTPPGGHILDPFTGSGSTGRGAVLEGFEFSGFELSPEYKAIADARVLDAEEEVRNNA